MKHLFFPLAVLFFLGCGISDQKFNDLKNENQVLSAKIDSLSKELIDLKFGAKNLLAEAKAKIESKSFTETKALLTTIISKYPASHESTVAKNLLKSIAPKAEEQSFSVATKSNDIALLKTYINDYPKGKYLSRANKIIRQYQRSDPGNTASGESISKSTGVAKKPVRKTTHYESSTIRVGALCCDGTRSYATGRGACSHHGGVCEWLYQ